MKPSSGGALATQPALIPLIKGTSPADELGRAVPPPSFGAVHTDGTHDAAVVRLESQHVRELRRLELEQQCETEQDARMLRLLGEQLMQQEKLEEQEVREERMERALRNDERQALERHEARQLRERELAGQRQASAADTGQRLELSRREHQRQEEEERQRARQLERGRLAAQRWDDAEQRLQA